MKLEAIPCPCGHCNKWLVTPLFHSQDATLSKDDADELVRRWNSFWEPPEMYSHEVKQLARKLDPECWISYSGKPKAFKQQMDKRRTAALQKAEQQIKHRRRRTRGLK